ncbi:MAG TPA: LamG domain-containing protein [Anaeromyxobacter sp.]
MNRLLLALSLALPLAVSAQVRPEDLQRGLVASLPLDGDAVDEISRLRAMPVATRPFEDRNGVPGGALWFDGQRSAVNLGNALQPGRFTLSAWIRPEAVDRIEVILSKIANLPGSWQKNFELRLNAGGRLFLHVPSGRGWEGVEGSRPIPPGRWTHVAAVYDGGRARLFVDGAPDGAPLAVRYEQSPTDTWIGARPEQGGRDGRTPSGPTFFFFGAIDDVRVWDRALSEAEIATLSGRVAFAPPPPRPMPGPPAPPPQLPARPVPIALYPFDGDARDAVGGADGTLAGTRPAEDRSGNPRGALGFGGKDHVDLGRRVEPERFSLAVWVRPSRGDREQIIFSKLSTTPGPRQKWLELKVEAFGRVVLTIPTPSPFNGSVQSSGRLPSGRWTHLAATYDGERAVLYLDGIVAGEARVDPFDGSRGPVFVGARPDPAGRRARFAPLFDGRMDDLRVYRGALSPEEVAAIARGGGDRPRPPPYGGGGERGDDDEPDHLLVKAGRMLVRYDAACLRGDAGRIARVEERIGRELEEAARATRGDRELSERLRSVARELQNARGQTDPMSLDRKRSALFSLSEALWNEFARDMDSAVLPYAPDPGGPMPQGERW